MPRLVRLAVFWNPPNPAYGPVSTELEAAGRRMGVELHRLEGRTPEDFGGALLGLTIPPSILAQATEVIR